MSLKHEYNRGDETPNANPVILLDSYLTHLADRCADEWQAHTKVSRQALTLALYLGATFASFVYVAVTHELLFLGVALLAYSGSLPGRRGGALIEELQLEVSGLPRHLLKYLAVGVLAIGLFGIVTSLPVFALGLAHGDLNPNDTAGLAGGVALTVLKIADYIVRTNPSPKDGDREQPIERVRRRAMAPGAV